MSTEETKVAVMQKQVEYITKQIDKILSKLDDNSLRNDETIRRLEKSISIKADKVELYALLKEKAEAKELIKIERHLSKIYWWVISTVGTILLGALIGLIIIK